MAKTRVNLLPPDVQDLIAKYSGQPAARFFVPITDNTALIRQYTVRPFLDDVLCDRVDMVTKFLWQDPGLLLLADRGVNYSGQIFENSTALQLAWGARDYQMCVLLIDFFEQEGLLPVALAQVETKFPEDRSFETLPYNFDYVREAFLTNNGVREAVTRFKADFAPGIVASGYHFNIHNLDYACWLYDTHLANIPQALRDTFWREIIGYLQRLVPAHLATVLSYGLYNVLEEKCEPRLGTFNLNGDKKYYPLDQIPAERLGYEVAIHTASGSRIIAQNPLQTRIVFPDEPHLSLLIKYHQQQEMKFIELRQRLKQPGKALFTKCMNLYKYRR